MGIRIRIRQIGATTGKTISLPASYGELLTIAKTKLGLPSAAQRIFTKEGDEIDDADFGTIQNDDVLYISCGEAFKPPAEATGAQAPTSRQMHRDQVSARHQMQEQLLGSDHSVPVVPTRRASAPPQPSPPMPPGCTAGGRWVKQSYYGPTSTILSVPLSPA